MEPRTRLALLRVLPRGQSLPESAWQARHKGVLLVLWAHGVALPLFALVRGFPLAHAALEGAIVPVAAALAASSRLGRRTRTAVASVGLLSSSAILVHLSGGVIEAHFHFFVMVALVALYQDWLPFLAAVGYVFLHHGLLGVLDADSVYNHAAARENPWAWAAIHAAFITGISVVCLVTWRLNELSLSARDVAEERLREETHIVETLHRVGQTLAAELDTRHIVQAVTDAATELTSASFGAFFYNVVAPSGESYLLYTLSGAPIEAFEWMGLPRNTAIFGPTFAGDEIVRLADVTQDARYGLSAPHFGMPEGHLPVRSYLAVPVRSRTGEVLGGLFFGHPEPARFTDIDERIVVGIAAQAAIAIDNARLYESERQAHAASEEAGARLAVLAEASRVLTSSLELDVVLGDLARLVSPALAETCLVDLVDEDGLISRVAGPVDGAYPPHLPGQSDPVARVIRSGRSEVVPAAAVAVGPPGAGTAADAPRYAIVAPLTGRRDVLGALTLVGTAGGLDHADVPFAEELARRAAIAVENARLYARQRTVAETLQHSLLPDRLPEVPGIATAASYLAGGPDVEVGGDWYDMVQLPGGRIGLVIGDVVGRGERAAALMGQLRSALRAYCRDGRQPHEILERLNAMLVDAGPEHMATLLYIAFDAETGEVTYANAGHPPPLLASPDGTAVFLDAERGVPIGALSGARYGQASATLPTNGTLILYTDGLVEERTASIDDGMAMLRAAVLDAPESLDELCAHVIDRALGGRTSHDDAAILAVRLLALGDRIDLRLPATPTVLGPLRAVMRRWLTGLGATEQETFELLVAVGELCANAIRHASGPARSSFEVHGVLAGHLTISVKDEGRWRDVSTGVGGRGLAIVEEYADRLDIDRTPTGTEVTLHRTLSAVPLPAVAT